MDRTAFNAKPNSIIAKVTRHEEWKHEGELNEAHATLTAPVPTLSLTRARLAAHQSTRLTGTPSPGSLAGRELQSNPEHGNGTVGDPA